MNTEPPKKVAFPGTAAARDGVVNTEAEGRPLNVPRVPRRLAAAPAPQLKERDQVHPAVVRKVEQRITAVPLNFKPQRKGLAGQHFLPLPDKGRRSRAAFIWFSALVLAPTIFSFVYYNYIATPQYVTEFRFTVKDTSASAAMTTPTSVLSMLGGSASSTTNDNFIVVDFLTSRQAAEEIDKRLKARALYSEPRIDWWSRYNRHGSIEDFARYWKTMVRSDYDVVTGIATAQVRAFSPQDSYNIASTLVSLSENLVNTMERRTQVDAVRYAEAEVNKAQDRLKKVRAQLTDYRKRFGIIDANASITASNSALVQSLRANLAQLETQLNSLQSQHLSDRAPTIISLKAQVQSTKEQLARTENEVGTSKSGSALSTIVGDYEQLNLDVQFAQTMVTSTMTALDQARATAAAQHIYIEPFVRPSLPESSTYPNVAQSVISVAASAFAIWLIGLLVIRSIRERFA